MSYLIEVCSNFKYVLKQTFYFINLFCPHNPIMKIMPAKIKITATATLGEEFNVIVSVWKLQEAGKHWVSAQVGSPPHSSRSDTHGPPYSLQQPEGQEDLLADNTNCSGYKFVLVALNGPETFTAGSVAPGMHCNM